MNCCQEVKQRIAMAKELRKRPVKCFVWSVALYGADFDTKGMSENDWKHLRCGYVEELACKMDRQNKKCSCAEKSERRKKNAGTDKGEEKKLTGQLVKKEVPAEGCSRRYGKREESSRQKKISDDRQHYDKWTV